MKKLPQNTRKNKKCEQETTNIKTIGWKDRKERVEKGCVGKSLKLKHAKHV